MMGNSEEDTYKGFVNLLRGAGNEEMRRRAQVDSVSQSVSQSERVLHKNPTNLVYLYTLGLLNFHFCPTKTGNLLASSDQMKPLNPSHEILIKHFSHSRHFPPLSVKNILFRAVSSFQYTFMQSSSVGNYTNEHMSVINADK